APGHAARLLRGLGSQPEKPATVFSTQFLRGAAGPSEPSCIALYCPVRPDVLVASDRVPRREAPSARGTAVFENSTACASGSLGIRSTGSIHSVASGRMD